MAASYSMNKEDKERLIAYVHELKRINAGHMRNLKEKYAKDCENKVLRRLNTVSVTVRDVKVKDVLEVERHDRPQIRTLLADINHLHENDASLRNQYSQ